MRGSHQCASAQTVSAVGISLQTGAWLWTLELLEVAMSDKGFQVSKRWGQNKLNSRRHQMSLGTILLIVLVLLLIGVIPSWPHSRGWGYGPSGGVGLVLVILLILFLMGRI